MNNMKAISICIGIAVLAINIEASRSRHPVYFKMPQSDESTIVVPFTASVPKNFRGSFVRFVNPRNAKTSNATYIGCEMAKPSAGPINGAVHGLATVVANTPVKNDDESESDGSEDWPNDIMLVPNSR